MYNLPCIMVQCKGGFKIVSCIFLPWLSNHGSLLFCGILNIRTFDFLTSANRLAWRWIFNKWLTNVPWWNCNWWSKCHSGISKMKKNKRIIHGKFQQSFLYFSGVKRQTRIMYHFWFSTFIVKILLSRFESYIC